MGIFSRILKSIFMPPEVIGKQGELLASSKLGWIKFWGYDGMVLHNVYIPKRNGETTEIDLLFITEKGIFVIESKNYSGYIFGNELYKTWTSTLYAGKTWYGAKKVEKYHFYNPIWQNKTHIKYLKELLTEWDIPMYSLVVFSDRCELKDVTINSDDVYVFRRNEMNFYIKSIWKHCDSVLTEETISEIYNQLLSFTNLEETLIDSHVDTIKKKLQSTDTCPWCGGNLVLRTARKGIHAGERFYGCSNYPMCRYIKNI
ncbi:MAG: NERD domain-containing protein [Firmicutes bacterium]|nr:NERD domain-containing protein [Bacillota bacterium]